MTESGLWPSLLATLALAARTLGFLMFAVAVHHKVRNWREFSLVVSRYLAVPVGSARYAAVAVIAFESATLLLLLGPQTGALGATLAMLLLLTFAGFMANALRRGETQLDCGCGGIIAVRQRVHWTLVLRNLLLAIAFIPLLASPDMPRAPLMFIDGIAAGAILFIASQALNAFVALHDSFAELRRRYG